MTLYYSKNTKGFYDSEIHGKNIPKDKIEISREDHLRLLDGQSKGFIIEGNEDGFPVLKTIADMPEEVQIVSHNAPILSKIREIERELQPRAMRDVILYNDNTRLVDLDRQISDLRSQLK